MCTAQAHIVSVINNEKGYKVQRIGGKPTSALEQMRPETEREEINTGLLDMSHTWTENSFRQKKRQDLCTLTQFYKLYFF